MFCQIIPLREILAHVLDLITGVRAAGEIGGARGDGLLVILDKVKRLQLRPAAARVEPGEQSSFEVILSRYVEWLRSGVTKAYDMQSWRCIRKRYKNAVSTFQILIL